MLDVHSWRSDTPPSSAGRSDQPPPPHEKEGGFKTSYPLSRGIRGKFNLTLLENPHTSFKCIDFMPSASTTDTRKLCELYFNQQTNKHKRTIADLTCNHSSAANGLLS